MNARINDYDFEEPRLDELQSSLTRILGDAGAQTALRTAARELEPPLRELEALPPEHVLGLARAMTAQRGLAAVIARSFVIRLESYSQLASRELSHD